MLTRRLRLILQNIDNSQKFGILNKSLVTSFGGYVRDIMKRKLETLPRRKNYFSKEAYAAAIEENMTA